MDDDTLAVILDGPMPCTAGHVRRIARNYRGVSHGNDRHGVEDIEFPDTYSAASFADISEADGWRMRPRDPITDLNRPVVLQVQLRPCPHCQAPATGWCEPTCPRYPGPDTLGPQKAAQRRTAPDVEGVER